MTGLLVLVLLLSSAQGSDRPALQDLVALEVTDPVTGLPNGRYLEQASLRVVGHTSRTAPVAVVVARIERLDDLAREHGHDLVDMALERLGRRLRAVLREDDVLARTAPGELVVLLPCADGAVRGRGGGQAAGRRRCGPPAGACPDDRRRRRAAPAHPRPRRRPPRPCPRAAAAPRPMGTTSSGGSRRPRRERLRRRPQDPAAGGVGVPQGVATSSGMRNHSTG